MTNITLPKAQIKIEGADIAATVASAVEQAIVETSLHLPSMLTLTLYDPKLTLSDGATFALGGKISLAAAVDQSPVTIFDGEIVETELEYHAEEYRLVVRALDRLHRLARGTKTRTFLNVKDSDLVSKLAGEGSMSADADATAEVFPYLLQAGESNLQFLQRRAAANGRLLYADGQKLCFKKVSTSQGAATATCTAGLDLLSFRGRTSTLGVITEAKVRGWDVKQKAAIVGSTSSATNLAATGEQRKQPFGSVAHEHHDLELTSQSAATALAGSFLLAHDSRFIEAEGVALGNPKVVAGAIVELAGLGTRRNGKYFVTSAVHRFQNDEPYTVEFSASGVNPATLLAALLPPSPAAAPRLMPAVVTNIKDPDNMGRVKVKLPLLLDGTKGSEIESDWARVVVVGAGAGRGLQWSPEINDEVLVLLSGPGATVAFVLGGLWNGQDKPQLPSSQLAASDGAVVKRSLKTRAGHEIVFDDEENKGGITIKDRKGNTIQIKSEDDSLTITAQGDLTLKASKKLTLESTGALSIKTNDTMTLEATQTLSVKGTQDVAIEATNNATLKGTMGTTVESSAMLTLKATGPAKLESTAVTEVKGSLVKIN